MDMPENILKSYQEEFNAKRTFLIKERVKLFCLFSVGIYFITTFLSLIFTPEEFKLEEMPLWGALVAAFLLILWLNHKAKTLSFAKFNAYLFTVFLLVIVTRVNIIYYHYAYFSSLIYLFILFLVIITIPWSHYDALVVGALHLAAYSSMFFYLRSHFPAAAFRVNFTDYADSMLVLAAASFLGFVVRRREAKRDKDNFILLKEIQARNKQMEKELTLATRVHKTLVPSSQDLPFADIAVSYLPVSFIGGDYARFHFLKDDKIVFIICDVTGHGVSAALLVNRVHTEFERLVNDALRPGALLKKLDEFISRDFAGINMYLSSFCGLLDFREKTFFYSNHGHPSQCLYCRSSDTLVSLGPQAPLLGLPFGKKEIYEDSLSFGTGDKIVLFTDGLIEAKNEKKEEFSSRRLEEFIKQNYALVSSAFNSKLIGQVKKYCHNRFDDDIFVLTVSIKGNLA